MIYRLLVTCLLSLGFMHAALDERDNLSSFVPELKAEIVSQLGDEDQLLDPTTYSSMSTTNSEFHDLCLEFYKNKMEQFLGQIFVLIHPHLVINFKQKKIFESLKSFKEVYHTAKSLLIKPMADLMNEFEVTDTSLGKFAGRSTFVGYLKKFYLYLECMSEMATPGSNELYRDIKATGHDTFTLGFYCPIDSWKCSDILLWQNQLGLFKKIQKIFKIGLGNIFWVRLEYKQNPQKSFGLDPLLFAIAYQDADLLELIVELNAKSDSPLYVIGLDWAIRYGAFVWASILHYLNISPVFFDENNWQTRLADEMKANPEKIRILGNFLFKLLTCSSNRGFELAISEKQLDMVVAMIEAAQKLNQEKQVVV